MAITDRPEMGVDDGVGVTEGPHLARSDRSSGGDRDVSNVAFDVCLRVVSKLCALGQESVRQFHFPVFHGLGVNEFSRKVITCRAKKRNFSSAKITSVNTYSVARLLEKRSSQQIHVVPLSVASGVGAIAFRRVLQKEIVQGIEKLRYFLRQNDKSVPKICR